MLKHQNVTSNALDQRYFVLRNRGRPSVPTPSMLRGANHILLGLARRFSGRRVLLSIGAVVRAFALSPKGEIDKAVAVV